MGTTTAITLGLLGSEGKVGPVDCLGMEEGMGLYGGTAMPMTAGVGMLVLGAWGRSGAGGMGLKGGTVGTDDFFITSCMLGTSTGSDAAGERTRSEFSYEKDQIN